MPLNMSISESSMETRSPRIFMGKRVAIYTLTEQAAKRAAEMLQEVCLGLEVHIIRTRSVKRDWPRWPKIQMYSFRVAK